MALLLFRYDGRKEPPRDKSSCLTNGAIENRIKRPLASDDKGSIRGAVDGGMPQVQPGGGRRRLMAKVRIGPEGCHVGNGSVTVVTTITLLAIVSSLLLSSMVHTGGE